jgi:O-antigen polysaccharide polymerase Wzy
VLTADEYLRYALPATAALWIGLHIPASRRLSKTWEMPHIDHLSKRVQHSLDVLIVAGLIADLYVDYAPVEWSFLAYLISSFRFVGALGWMLTLTPGWRWRVIFVLAHLTAVQSTGGLFYLVVHWGGYFLLVYAFMRRWRWQMAVALCASLLGLSLLQAVKPTLRTSIAEQRVTGPLDSLERLTSMMWDRVKTGQFVDTQTDAGDSLVRFNQGWIIARIMTHVPAEIPYARGQTITDAITFSIIPRFLFPDKLQGASQKIFSTYTGTELAGGTRMGLGIIGEFYANFGMGGGIVGTFVYGLIIGWVFLLFADRAQKNPLWWAAASTVLVPSVEPGINLEDILNHVVKAAVVLFVVWKITPQMQRLLAPLKQFRDDEDDEDISKYFDVAS